MTSIIQCELSGKFLAVDADQGANAQGTQLIQFSATGDGTQQWSVEAQFTDGNGNVVFLIRNVGSGMCVDTGATQEAGTQLIQWPQNGSQTQLWTALPVEGVAFGFAFQNVVSGLFMNVQGRSLDDLAPVIQWPESNSVEENAVWIVTTV
jgi:hypothetical protein